MEDRSIAIPRKGFPDYSPFFILDKFLSILTVESTGGRTSSGFVDTNIIYKELQTLEIHLNNDEFINVLEKLLKDEFIEKIDIGSDNWCKINFDGLAFIKQGGYNQKFKNEELLREKLEIDNRRAKLNTLITTIATVIAAITGMGIVLWEVYKVYHKV